MNIQITDNALNEKFLSKGLTELYRKHGKIISIYDGNPEDGRHFDLANVCDEAIDGYKPYDGSTEGYINPVMITFDDGYTILIEGHEVNPEGWQRKTTERKGGGKLFRRSINESCQKKKRIILRK